MVNNKHAGQCWVRNDVPFRQRETTSQEGMAFMSQAKLATS